MIVLGSPSADNIITPNQDFWLARQISNLFRKRWVYHLLFWLIYYLFICLLVVFGMFRIYDPTFYVQLIAFFLLDMAMVYFNFYVLIPRLLLPGKYFYYGLSLAIAILI